MIVTHKVRKLREEFFMTNKHELVKGGAFLIEDIEADRMMTPDDIMDDDKKIAAIKVEYVEKDVTHVVQNLENHEFEHSVRVLKKAGELGLLEADIPEEYDGFGLDKI